jgi:hypothetical protein
LVLESLGNKEDRSRLPRAVRRPSPPTSQRGINGPLVSRCGVRSCDALPPVHCRTKPIITVRQHRVRPFRSCLLLVARSLSDPRLKSLKLSTSSKIIPLLSGGRVNAYGEWVSDLRLRAELRGARDRQQNQTKVRCIDRNRCANTPIRVSRPEAI